MASPMLFAKCSAFLCCLDLYLLGVYIHLFLCTWSIYTFGDNCLFYLCVFSLQHRLILFVIPHYVLQTVYVHSLR